VLFKDEDFARPSTERAAGFAAWAPSSVVDAAVLLGACERGKIACARFSEVLSGFCSALYYSGSARAQAVGVLDDTAPQSAEERTMGSPTNDDAGPGAASPPPDEASASVPAAGTPAPTLANGSVPPAFDTGAIVLKPEQVPEAEKAVAALDFAAMRSGDVIKIGLDAETSLQRTLDGFLARLDKKTAAKVFDLFGRLEKGVDDAKLPEVLEKVQKGEKPGLLGLILGKLRGKGRDQVAQELLAEIGDLVAGRTRTLADEMDKLERQLEAEMQNLFAELKSLDTLKESYGTHFSEFTLAAGVARAFAQKSRTYVAGEQASLNPADVAAQARVQELQDKLRLLESRALALEGTYTRLPADRLVIQQIEQAGVATLQETATTVASRFASIKMTLLSINGAFAVMSVQQVVNRQAQLDRQLTEVRGRAVKEVAVSAAQAPGENRLAQAQQIEQIIATTKEIHGLVQIARQTTEEKFEQARQKFAAARQELASLAQTQAVP